jgi:cystathionine gamma-synthase
MPDDRAPQTVAAANGIATDRTFGAVVPPLYLSSTFVFAGFEQARGYDCTRTANPDRAMLADTVARLEGGAGGIVVSSGMAAVDLVLSRLRSDDLIVAPHDCYAGTWRLLAARRDRGQFDVAFIDQGDDVALASACNRSPRSSCSKPPAIR